MQEDEECFQRMASVTFHRPASLAGFLLFVFSALR